MLRHLLRHLLRHILVPESCAIFWRHFNYIAPFLIILRHFLKPYINDRIRSGRHTTQKPTITKNKNITLSPNFIYSHRVKLSRWLLFSHIEFKNSNKIIWNQIIRCLTFCKQVCRRCALNVKTTTSGKTFIWWTALTGYITTSCPIFLINR